MKTRAILLLSILGLILGSACQKTDAAYESGKSGRLIKVPLKLSVLDEAVGYYQSMNGDTKAPVLTPTQETEVNDLWVFQLSGLSGTATPVVTPVYVKKLSAGVFPAVYLRESGEVQNRIVVIANTHDSTLFASNPMSITYAQLQSAYRWITDESQAYGAGLGMQMSGMWTGYVNQSALPSGQLSMSLVRSMARIKLSLKLDATLTGFSIQSVQLKNVSRRMEYLDAFNTHGTIDPASVTPSDYIDYPIVTGGMPLPGSTGEYQWYVPRNHKGVNESANDMTKNYLAPAYASYLYITLKDASGNPFYFTFYPGENMYNDFNIYGNNYYHMSYLIIGKGDPSIDYRVTY